MNVFSKDIADLLVTAGIGALGGSSDWGIFVNQEPEAPDKCITIIDTNGSVDNYISEDNAIEVDYPTCQIRIRANVQDVNDIADKYAAIATAINGQLSTVVGTITYGVISKTTAFEKLTIDESARVIYVQNYRASRIY